MKLNTDMEDMSEKNQYILAYLPVVKQKTYTLGAVYKHYSGKNIYSLIISRSQLNNRNIKYNDNDESSEGNLTLDYRSDESKINYAARIYSVSILPAECRRKPRIYDLHQPYIPETVHHNSQRGQLPHESRTFEMGALCYSHI